ncbi:MAG: hypothetical protein HN560_04490 [Anaerolineae bacterium]|nr:hypothetical protein [Anaerolineae bacterium]
MKRERKRLQRNQNLPSAVETVYTGIYHRILKLSRANADFAREENVQSTHLAEALQYKPKGVMV